MTTVKENFNENIKNVIDLINNLKKLCNNTFRKITYYVGKYSELPYPVIENNKGRKFIIWWWKKFFIHLLFILSIIYSLTVSIKVPEKQ